MLPTKGYFQDIECPYYDNTCNRPYCHFRHRKKCQEPAEEIITETAVIKEGEVPTYKPTPKSELANIKSHIPISYVPDLAFRPHRTTRPIPKFSYEQPTYKPTPLSILSSANNKNQTVEDEIKETDDDIEAIREIKQNIASLEYNPEVSLQDDINFEDLSAEFDLIDDIIEQPTAEESPKNNSAKENENNEQKPETNVDKADKTKAHRSKHHRNDKEKRKEDSREKHSKTKDKSDEKRHSSSSSHKSRSKSSRERDKERSKHKDKDRRKSSTKHKDRDKDKRKEKRPKDSEKKPQQKSSDEDNSLINNDDYVDIDEFGDEEETLLECYKIFNEYKAPVEPETSTATEKVDKIEEESPVTTSISKKRIAHGSNSTEHLPLHKAPPKPKFQPSAAQVMANRFKLAKIAQSDNEQKNIMNEVKQSTVKRPPPTLLEAARSLKIQKMSKPKPPVETANVIDSILNGAKNKPKKIAPVQNVTSIQRAKAKIEEIAKHKAAETLLNKTVAQTVKGAKRTAHIPDISLSDIPDVLNYDKSKLPINVRTRFLTMIADECVKLYLMKEDAYNRALNEEFSCYEKCKVLNTYKNSAMLAVNRLRKELQEREKMGLGPIGAGESSTKEKSSELKGKRFYDNVKKYVLSEEELDIHGYPKESVIPGHATIKNRKTTRVVNLEENQRKCSRCSKIYVVDDDGVVLYKEECVYHPLKKRTLRGEQTYLCCKSNDDTGCATSNTHVSEMSEDAELEGYQMTMEPEQESDPRSCAVYALDCEMCYTTKGLELTRVTIVDPECKTVYESLVKPLNPIIDYNTNFSGITKEQMDKTSTSILQVQANILHLCNSKTILIGHSLESDMKALKIIHGTVIDTAVLFPHKMGLPHKRALRVLASEHLKKIIQNNVSGHDSAEDAITCMDLVKWKLREELKVRGIK